MADKADREIERAVVAARAQLEQQPGMTIDLSDKMGEVIRDFLTFDLISLKGGLLCYAIALRTRAFHKAANLVCDAVQAIGDPDAPKKNRP